MYLEKNLDYIKKGKKKLLVEFDMKKKLEKYAIW